MKKIAIVLSIILAMGIFASCGKKDNASSTPSTSSNSASAASANIEGSLTDIMVKLYEGTEDDVPKTMDTEITGENSVNYIGVESGTYKEALGSDAAISAQAHSVCLVRAESGEAAVELAKEIEAKADPRKWICVEAEKKAVKQYGDLVLLVMTNEVAADKILANFDALTK